MTRRSEGEPVGYSRENPFERFLGPAVLGSGCFLPGNIVKQELVEEMLGLRPGLGVRLTGVKERRFFRNPQTLKFDTDFPYPEVKMAYFAAQSALSEGGGKCR